MLSARKSPNFKEVLFVVCALGGLFFLNELLVGFFGVVVRNSGASFGLNMGGVLLNIIVLTFLGWWVIWKERNGWLLLVVLGGVLNIIDRMRFGFVRDYWHLACGLHNNLADWMIVLGAGTFIISLWKKR